MPSITFALNISAQDYLTYYQGKARQVRVEDRGRTTLFPAEGLRPFVTHSGIQGRFILTYDANNKFVSLEKL